MREAVRKQIQAASPAGQGQLVLQYVHAALLTLRRCLQGVTYRDDETGSRTELGHCQRPATRRMQVSGGCYFYTCDGCAALFGETPPSAEELPHAGVVRRYNEIVASPATLEAVTARDAVQLGHDLVAALPPCPNARIDWSALDTIAAAPARHLLTEAQLARLAVRTVDVIGDPEAGCVRCENIVVWARSLTELDELLDVLEGKT